MQGRWVVQACTDGLPALASIVGGEGQAVCADHDAALSVEEVQVEEGFVGPVVYQTLRFSQSILGIFSRLGLCCLERQLCRLHAIQLP
ncbi:hypothetical protein D3C80_1806560 [compost metagenome]